MKLTPEQRDEVFRRWLAGNWLAERGGVPESMEAIGKSYGITKQAVWYIVKQAGGKPAQRPKRGPRAGRCRDCKRPSPQLVTDRCRRCYLKHRWATLPEWRAHLMENQRRYRAKRKSAALNNEPTWKAPDPLSQYFHDHGHLFADPSHYEIAVSGDRS